MSVSKLKLTDLTFQLSQFKLTFLKNVTLADEDTNSIPTDEEANRAIQGNVKMQISPTRFVTNASGATWWQFLTNVCVCVFNPVGLKIFLHLS